MLSRGGRAVSVACAATEHRSSTAASDRCSMDRRGGGEVERCKQRTFDPLVGSRRTILPMRSSPQRRAQAGQALRQLRVERSADFEPLRWFVLGARQLA
jgi:hypothetical protein